MQCQRKRLIQLFVFLLFSLTFFIIQEAQARVKNEKNCKTATDNKSAEIVQLWIDEGLLKPDSNRYRVFFTPEGKKTLVINGLKIVKKEAIVESFLKGDVESPDRHQPSIRLEGLGCGCTGSCIQACSVHCNESSCDCIGACTSFNPLDPDFSCGQGCGF